MTAKKRFAPPAASIALIAACFNGWHVERAFADEGGVSFWSPGSYASLAAEQQEPGWSLAVTNYFAATSAGASVARAREIQIGAFPAGLSATLNASYQDKIDYVVLEPGYVFATPVLGGQASIGMSTFVGRDSANLAGSLTGTLMTGGGPVPFARSDNISSAITGVGDLSPLATLRWNRDVNNLMVYATGNIPVGAYDPQRLSNLGLGHGAVDAGGAYTYLSPDNKQEFSGTLGFTYNLANMSTQYQSGIDMHFDWGASRFLTEWLQIGLAGYVYRQISCDGGSGNRVGCFESQVAGIGPQVGFYFPVGGMDGNLSLRAYKDFAVENRPGGWNAWLALSLSPRSGGNADPAKSAKPVVTK